MDRVAEVARIKAELKAREDAWMAAIYERLTAGPATSAELADACGVKSRAPFSNFLNVKRKSGALVVVATTTGRTGHLNNLWGMP